jgi:peroxiredoxin
MPLPHPGGTVPELTLTVPGGQTVTMPGALAGRFGVLLFYRGPWCPYRTAQLRAFQRAGGVLADAGVRVAALPAGDQAATAALIAGHGLTFPVGYGADARKVAGLTGAFVNPGPVHLQSTAFVTGPQGKIVVSVYSSGPSASSCPTTWPGSSATSASTPRHRPDPHPERP